MLATVLACGSATAQVRVKGSVFGGGNNAGVQTNTEVNISAGQVEGNVYGGGNVGDVGTITKSADYNYTWKQSDGTTDNVAEHNTNATATNTGICTVNITGGTIGVDNPADAANQGNVFGAGRGLEDTWWCEKAIVYATSVTISKSGTTGTVVKGNVYGGGQVGRVEDDAKVVIGTADGGDEPDIRGSVFGAGAGLQTHGYSALVRGNAAVTVQGKAKVGGSVYGGGETASVGRFTVVGGLPKHPDSGGYCTVTIQDNAQIGTSGTGHNVYGACKGVTPAFVADGENRPKSMQLRENAPSDDTLWSSYNNDENSPFIWRYYASEEDYKAFLRTLALTSHPTVTIDENATVYGSVYGGGERGMALGNVDVNITGGTVEQDVYGGGALADTNAANANSDGYAVATVTAGETVVTGMYTRSGTGTDTDPYVYTVINTADAKAEAGTTYYSTVVPSSINTTSVDLTGGLIKGDAYGGGLGQRNGFNDATSDIAATVFGDIEVTLNGTAFNISNYDGEGHTDIVKSGRVFGCNNLLGSPQGNVTVKVHKTVYGNIHRTTEDPENTGKATKNDGQHHNYEVAAVYGGGNLANYTATGKKASVIIETCDVSIESVYGGGNAAEVPETDVDVNGAYEIGTVFGGGNGNDPYTTDGGTTWVENPGANVNGNANTLLTGGYIHEAYGGSNKRGTIMGNVTIDVGTGGSCTLDVGKVVAAGKNADVNGNLIVIMGCKPSEKVPVLFAGADDANVYGDVELTITSGNFGQVFGGNNAGGAIYGHIKLNIEETGDCGTPITIDSLYLGGNQAAYSVYGYKTEEDKLVPQSADELKAAIANDNPGKTEEELAELFNSTKQEDPELNIISCTYIGQVFGGGYGTGAYMYADPKVNINMIQGSKSSDVPTFMTADPRMTALNLDTNDNPNKLGIIGTVYGGGNAADVYGNPTVNIGTLSTVRLHESLQADGVTYNWSQEQEVLGAYIVGNVFGGGKGEAKMTAGTAGEAFLCAKAMVNGDEGTHVNIGNGFVRGNVYGGGEVGRVENNTVVTIGLAEVPEGGKSTPVVNGNVFGAGKGVNTHGYAALVRGTSKVVVQADAKVLSSVYGGGEKASVGRYKVGNDGLPQVLDDSQNPNSGYCYVTIKDNAEIGPDNMSMTKEGGPDDTGYVFGAGKGILPYEEYDDSAMPKHMDGIKQNDGSWEDNLKTYPAYSANSELDADYVKFIKSLALATQTEVSVEDNAFVKGGVYGGSENGFVQKNTKVTIKDQCQIGNGYVQMNDDGGYLDNPLAVNRRYTEAEWTAGHLILDENDRNELRTLVGEIYYTSSLPECASWKYGQATNDADRYAPYDKFYGATGYVDSKGGRLVGDDGHTFYGNVFGGGSGYYPYRPGRWFMDAGAVYGDTQVDITGGHILTSIYGGNEMTDVSGTCTVNFGGTATLGVPRTLKQIGAHPVTCYLFGAGKGDQRVFFNKNTNVRDVEVNITGGTIYGSVFGGGEDGHVMRDVKVTIGQQTTTGEGAQATTTVTGPTIGTWGTSYVDGNVFGGGRGFSGDAYTAGNVAGSVKMEIKGGSILGSIYGGGRLGSVGYGLFESTNTNNYGIMQDDNKDDEGNTTTFYKDGPVGLGRGHIDITISGGTIGNNREYIIPNTTPSTGNAPSELDNTDFKAWTTEQWTAWKEHNSIPKTEFDTTTGQLTHTKGGNVFAGGMGNFYKQDGSTYINDVNWWQLGCVKSTKLTITGGTIRSNVYGGGELGQVVEHHTTQNANYGTEITIQGSNTTIGTEVKDASNNTQYTFGSVFGGGYGSLKEEITVNDGTSDVRSYPKYIAGRVKAGTKVNMTAGSVLASVYGGGEMAAVGESKTLGETLTTGFTGDTYVTISGGIIGKEKVGSTYFGGAKMGNVYGGGSGNNNTVRSGHVYGNTNVTISAGSVSGEPKIYHNVYGGGAYGSVGDFTYQTGTDAQTGTQKVIGISGLNENHSNSGVARVTITGGTIGYDGKENGMVFGSSRGDINEPGKRDDHTAWVYNANVIIGTAATPASGTPDTEGYVAATPASGPDIKGSVYGSGENGHTFNNTVVTVNGGIIGIDDENDDGFTVTSNGTSYSGAAYPYRGNVYGGGCGTDKYYSGSIPTGHTYNDGEGDYYNPLAGIVYGTTTVTINDGHVVRNVYGAGAMGSVGKTVTTTENNVTTTTISGGTTTIKVRGGTIGVDGTKGDGNVFGAARGDEDAIITEAALVKKNTNVLVTGGTIEGNVYGGGELGCVGTFTVSDDMRTFTWKNTDGTNNTDDNSDNKNTGICNVTVNGSSAVINGHVYGAGKGKEDTFWCEKGIAYSTNVNISNGTVGTLDANNKLVDGTGNVYGGGEVGRVETDTKVNIGEGDGTAGGSSTPTIRASVFGGGAGVETHGYSALVRGNTYVTVKGNAVIGHSVYGGGEIASVGRYGLDEQKMPSILQGGGYCYVKVQGYAQITDDVFGAGEGITPHFDKDNSDHSKRSRRMTLKNGWESLVGDARFEWDDLESESEYSTYLETLALATHPEVTIDGNATVSGSVFGGGELGLTKGSVIVNIQGGTIAEDVYGGGSLAHSNTTSTVETIDPETQQPTQTTVYPTTTVNLKGGTINRNVYGGGLGRLAKNAENGINYTAEEAAAYNTAHNLNEGDEGYKTTSDWRVEPVEATTDVEAKVYGEVLVKLNEPTTTTTGEGEGATTTTTYGDCVVKGTIFGCNNLNGSPQKDVTVHVYKTMPRDDTNKKSVNKDNTTYDLAAVYGGGNLASFCPDNVTARETAIANVIIDGCDLTSIKSVYGGGNAASVPATEVVVNGTYEIGEAFGGGNGKDDISYDGTNYVTNPGANVGYRAYPEGTNLDGRASYAYGIGKAHITIYGGTVHTVYGGSNLRGNVRVESRTTLEELGQCDYNVGDAFGGGNNADQDGDAILDVGCITGLDIAYGGASNADVNGDVKLNLTNGTYGRVFGGNNLGGAIRGSIFVNIEETGCNPIVIGELYCGGNEAAYSVYGYDDHGNVNTSGDNPVPHPVLNVKSFTSIGKIFGGGYGSTATLVGNPTVNVNVCEGKYYNTFKGSDNVINDNAKVVGSAVKYSESDAGYANGYPIPSHAKGAIGAINDVFGGGNEAKVIGNPTVNIGTEAGEKVYVAVEVKEGEELKGYCTRTGEGTTESPYQYSELTEGTAPNTATYYLKTVKAVDIRGNVFGGGNNAVVTGNTEVVIGKKKIND